MITDADYEDARKIGGPRLSHLLWRVVNEYGVKLPATSTSLIKCRGVSVKTLRQFTKLGFVIDGELDGLGQMSREVLCQLGLYTKASVIEAINQETLHPEMRLKIWNHSEVNYKRIKKWCGFDDVKHEEVLMYCSLCNQLLPHQRRAK